MVTALLQSAAAHIEAACPGARVLVGPPGRGLCLTAVRVIAGLTPLRAVGPGAPQRPRGSFEVEALLTAPAEDGAAVQALGDAVVAVLQGPRVLDGAALGPRAGKAVITVEAPSLDTLAAVFRALGAPMGPAALLQLRVELPEG